MQSVQQYGQNVPDRHTEAASVLLSLPQSHPSYPSNTQDGSGEGQQNFSDQLPNFPTGQPESPQMMQDFSGEPLDPMLSMTAAQGEATMNANAAAQQYPSASQPPAGSMQFPLLQHISQPVDLSALSMGLKAVLTDEQLHYVKSVIERNTPSPAYGINGHHVKLEASGISSKLWYDKAPGSSDAAWRPSPSSFLNTQLLRDFITTFFSRFHPVFPIAHIPTFQPAEKPLLSFAMATVGALSVFEPEVAAEVFAQLQTSLSTEWQRDVAAAQAIDFVVIQAALLSDLFTVLSGSTENVLHVESTHAKLATWAASIGSIDMQETLALLNTENMPTGEALEHIWRAWVQKEERIRVLHGLRILDAELADLFRRPHSITFDVNSLPQMAPEDLFQAWSATEWLSLLEKYPIYRNLSANSFDQAFEHYETRGQSTSRFAASTSLETIGANIDEARAKGTLDDARSQELMGQLMDFYHKFCSNPQVQDTDTFCLTILWHATFINLLVDYHMLEKAFGKDGPEQASSLQEAARQWASSETAQRCLTHAVLIEHYVNNLRAGREPSIHVPRCLYIAAMITLGHSRFANDNADGIDGISFPEIELVATSLSTSTPRASYGGPDITSRLRGLLFSVSHFELARKFGWILHYLIENGAGLSATGPDGVDPKLEEAKDAPVGGA